MKPPKTVKALEDLGRVRLSKSFFMREFLYSEISQIEGLPNVPDDPDLAIHVGKKLCEEVLEPIQDRLGRISIRSAFRSTAVNGRGAENKNQYGCAGNETNAARHIWDLKDRDGSIGAMACVVITPYLEFFEKTAQWEPLAWWIHDWIPGYSELEFFQRSTPLALNVSWHERPKKTITAWAPRLKVLTRPGMSNHGGLHDSEYADWLRAITLSKGGHR